MPPGPEFDLLFVSTTFRRQMVYLALARALSGEFRLALYQLPLAEAERAKTAATDRLFLQRCREAGIEVVAARQVTCHVALIPQWPFDAEQLRLLERDVRARERHWLVGLTMGHHHADHLGALPVDRTLVIDGDLHEFRLRHRPEEAAWGARLGERVEVGLPFREHSVGVDPGIDWLIANPTPLSLPTTRAKLTYLRTVRSLLEQIPAHERVALKPHNASERHDYIPHPRLLALWRLLGWRSLRLLLRRVLEALAASVGDRSSLLTTARVALEYAEIERRTVPLRELTPDHNFSLEVFLPSVRKGVITGRSNTLWHALYCRLPVYNCVDDTGLDADTSKMNFITMQYLGVPYCHGRLEFDPRLFDVVAERVRQADLVGFYRGALRQLRNAEPTP